MTSKYYSILTKLSQRLSKDDLDNLVFTCGSILPISTAEKITTGIHLFRELKQRGHLGPANYDYLRQHLVLVGRHDLASMLPGQFEILFGQSSVQDKGYFGCFVSPTAPDTLSSIINVSLLKYCGHTDTESRMFLVHLSQQLNLEDAKQLAFLMYPTHSQVTALQFVELLEREGGLHSINVFSRLSACLETVGRVDLAQQLSILKMPQILVSSNSLSTSRLQLNLKMSLLLHSKQQSFDFYMRALSEVESNSEVRMNLLGPIYVCIQDSFSSLNITSLAKSIQDAFKGCMATNHKVDIDSLINNSLLEGLNVHQAYSTLAACFDYKEIPVGKLGKVNEQARDSYNSFNSLIEILNWNSVVRGELNINQKLHRTPFGTPAELACQYILELSQEISRGTKMYQEKQMTDCSIQALNTYYCCCYHVIVYSGLPVFFATLLHLVLLDLTYAE